MKTTKRILFIIWLLCGIEETKVILSKIMNSGSNVDQIQQNDKINFHTWRIWFEYQAVLSDAADV